MDTRFNHDDCGPWNPGLESQIPRPLLPLSTMFAPANVSTGFDEAHELSDFCGLSPFEIVAFRPERLIIHELLIRVTADLSVPDGPNYEDLGINLRAMVAKIFTDYIRPHLANLTPVLDEMRRDATELLEREMSAQLSTGASAVAREQKKKTFFNRIFSRRPPVKNQSTMIGKEQRLAQAMSLWTQRCKTDADPFAAACLTALVGAISAIQRHRGRLVGDNAMVINLAVNQVCNSLGSDRLGEAITPYIRQAAAAENYLFLPAQKKPVVMNVKGASAAGKSTIRPQQRQLAEKLGIAWKDFALISPDYWRKYLLDYDSLGEHYKYAAMLTGHELEVIDKKLDHYMDQKAGRGEISHLLIDRFRFDSFIVEADRGINSKLLTRFGDLIFMFFMITPPQATVERAWLRGLETGRFKAVDDLLYHNVEAYNGIPDLFFSWASVSQKKVHYEFLDNSVQKGHRPRTVAFGWNGEMTILDVKCMLDIERFRKINVDAKQADDIYRKEDMAPALNVGFLKRCKQHIPVINFADYETRQIYARLERGRWTWRDVAYDETVLNDPDTKAGLQAIGWGATIHASAGGDTPQSLESERPYLLGE